MSEAARPATPADVPRLSELARSVRAEMEQQRGGVVFLAREARAEPLEDSLAAELADTEGHALFVGTIDDFVIGYAAVHIEMLRTGDVLAVLTDLYVEEEARAVGVGEELMAAALEWSKSRHATAVDTYALPGDRNTKNFFEMSGFTARLLVMHHKL